MDHKDVLHAREFQTSAGETKTSWTKVGVAFPAKNGGLNVKLDLFPTDGKLFISDQDPKAGKNADGAAHMEEPDLD